MTSSPEIPTKRKLPNRKDAMLFSGKAMLLRIRRSMTDLTRTRVRRHAAGSALSQAPVAAASETRLWTETAPEERFLVAGKIHNLRVAVAKLNGVEVPAGETFSFWKQIGRAGRHRGFVVGRELREGCIIPNIGGGLCQLSNGLYDAAIKAGYEIVERHAHTQVIPGSLAEKGRDATVFWNYIDLRFRADQAFRIEASLDSEKLVIRFRGEKPADRRVHQISRTVIHSDGPSSCASCGEIDCHRSVDEKPRAAFGRTAYLVDEFSPEFDNYISASRTGKDLLMLPIDGRRFRKNNYAWATGGFARTRQSIFVTGKRSYRSRKLAAQGAARQLNLLRMYEELAESYASRLAYDVLHVVVQQNLLPFLWKNGHLGGRTFDVLMSALPMFEIQDRLDVAAALHPDSKTLGDFRARPDLVAAEREALKNARRLVTPHTEIASMFGERAEVLDWDKPVTKTKERSRNDKPVIVYPASTVGRKGCYELREALRELDVRLVVLGPLIESTDFWDGFDAERSRTDWLECADLVVLPAFVEHRPRRLLLALAAGIPVIASPACGIANLPGVETVDPGDGLILREKVVSVLKANAAQAVV